MVTVERRFDLGAQLSAKTGTTPETTIRWILTHDPISLFEDAARSFAQSVSDLSEGSMEVQVFTPIEYGKGKWIQPADVMQKVVTGEVQMSQTYTTVLGQLYGRLWALDLPYLFRDHGHAARVLEGEIGQELLEGLVPSGVRGLAFTYTGGYRLVSTTGQVVRSIDDFKGVRVRTSDNPVVKAVFEAIGARPHAAPLQHIPQLTEQDVIEAAESTWPRYWDMGHYKYQPVVADTGHSLFLTSLVVNEPFYQGLSASSKDVLHRSAIKAAAEEREKSVRDGDEAKRTWQAEGGNVVTWSEAERRRFAAAAEPVYERFAPEFGQSLIDGIRSTK